VNKFFFRLKTLKIIAISTAVLAILVAIIIENEEQNIFGFLIIYCQKQYTIKIRN
jgi:hypothetical protein